MNSELLSLSGMLLLVFITYMFFSCYRILPLSSKSLLTSFFFFVYFFPPHLSAKWSTVATRMDLGFRELSKLWIVKRKRRRSQCWHLMRHSIIIILITRIGLWTKSQIRETEVCTAWSGLLLSIELLVTLSPFLIFNRYLHRSFLLQF